VVVIGRSVLHCANSGGYMGKLTLKQESFCNEYLIDLNATQSAIRAGYSKKTAQRIGSENLSKPLIAAEIQELFNRRAERTAIDGDWVLKKLQKVAERCMQEEAVMVKGEAGMEESGEFKFDSAGANKSLELIGKHHKLFTEKVEHGGEVAFTQIERKII
jgi:phage terminase small subunit